MKDQTRKALAEANRVRTLRSQTLRELKRGEVLFQDLDLDAWYFRNMSVMRLLSYLPWRAPRIKGPTWHPNLSCAHEPLRVLQAMGLTERVRVSSLSEKRRAELKRVVAEMCSTQ